MTAAHASTRTNWTIRPVIFLPLARCQGAELPACVYAFKPHKPDVQLQMSLDGCVSVDAFRFLACSAPLRAVILVAVHLLAVLVEDATQSLPEGLSRTVVEE